MRSVRRGKIYLEALLLLALSLPARAQDSAGAKLVLPPRLVASQAATLAVLDSNGRLAPGSAVELWDGSIVVADSTGRARFVAPRTPGVTSVWLAGGKAQASAVVFAAPSGVPPGRAVQLATVPQMVSRDDRFFVTGTGFAGDADRNQVRLGGKAALVLAASPDSLVVLASPEAPLGPTRLEVGGASAPVTVVSLELPAALPRVAPGQRAKLPVRVAGTKLRLELEAQNLTPEVVQLRGGNPERVKTSGGTENSATLELEGLRPGDYSLQVRLVAAAFQQPDIEAARQALLIARQLAPRAQARALDQLIRELSRHPERYAGVRERVEAMRSVQTAAVRQAQGGPPGEFSRALEAAAAILEER